jgi:hypothetical protein
MQADVEGAQISGDHSEEQTARVHLEVIDSANAQSFGEAQDRSLAISTGHIMCY